MYLDSIRLQNFRTFRDASIDLVHPLQDFARLKIPKPRLPNLNLLLGNNGLGKSAFLKAVALAALGPAVGDAGIFPYRLVRREAATAKRRTNPDARIDARFTPNPQDRAPATLKTLESAVGIQAKGDLEKLQWLHPSEEHWQPIFQSKSDAFFLVGYSAGRSVEPRERVDHAARNASSFARAQRSKGLFQESFSLIPLTAWLPALRKSSPRRHLEILALINKLMGPGHYQFKGEMEGGEYLFTRGGLKVPFPALSDGYRSYLGWIGDLLFHLSTITPPDVRLDQNRGIVMVDEIDLHLHPKWQMTVLPILAKALPKLQFIVTSHSPLLVGSLEWMNIIVMLPAAHGATKPVRVPAAIHGLDADQVLLTDFFGMDTTRAAGKQTQLKSLTLKARSGDLDAAKQLMEQMSTGMETLP